MIDNCAYNKKKSAANKNGCHTFGLVKKNRVTDMEAHDEESLTNHNMSWNKKYKPKKLAD
jgi:hypothetical protein